MKLSQMPAPGPLTGLELTPVLQGGGEDGNAGIPLLAYGALPRGAVLLLRVPMVADLSATTDANPGEGKVRWNNAAPNSATELYISKSSAAPAFIDDELLAASIGAYIYLQSSGQAVGGDRDKLQKWLVTSVEDDTDYVRFGVTVQATGGVMVADDEIELSLQQPGPSPGIDRNVVTAVSSVSGVLTLDASLGDYFVTTLSEDVTSIVIDNCPQACTLSLRLMQNGTTAYDVTFPAAFLKRGGGDFVMPASLGARCRLVMTTDDTGASFDTDLGEGYE